MSRLHVVSPQRRVVGELSLPGDKSISHRGALLSIIASGPISIHGCSPAADVRASLGAAAAFGVLIGDKDKVDLQGIEHQVRESQILTLHREESVPPPVERRGDVGNSGTTLRIALGISASIPGLTYLDGDESIRRRPMKRVVGPLRAMGADIDGADGGEHAPLMVRGRALNGATHRLLVASAQVKSALLLAGLRASGRTVVSEPAASRDHTERMLRYLGVTIDISADGLVVEATDIPGGIIDVPGDISAAAPFMTAAALHEGSDLLLPGVGLNPTRTGFLDILREFGADVEVSDPVEVSGEPRGDLRIRAGDRRPLKVSGSLALRALDELPLVAVLGAFAEGRTEVSGAGELRVKESDRISATVAGLGALGARIEGAPDGFAVDGMGGLPGGAEVDPLGDHRLAMAFAVAGMASRAGASILNPSCVAVSHPGFFEDLASVSEP